MNLFEQAMSFISKALGGNWKAPSETNRNVQQRTEQSRQQQQNQNKQQNGSNQTGSTTAVQPTSIFRQQTNNLPGNRWNQQLQPVAQDVSPVYNTNIQAPQQQQQQRKQQDAKKEDEGAKKRFAANAIAGAPAGIAGMALLNLLGNAPTEQAEAEEADKNTTELKGDVEKTGSNDASAAKDNDANGDKDKDKESESKDQSGKSHYDLSNPEDLAYIQQLSDDKKANEEALKAAVENLSPGGDQTGPGLNTGQLIRQVQAKDFSNNPGVFRGVINPILESPAGQQAGDKVKEGIGDRIEDFERPEPFGKDQQDSSEEEQQLIDGMTQEQWDDLTQREQFNHTMFDDNGNLTDFGNAVVNAFGDTYSNRDDAYEQWRLSNNRDLTAALMGLSGEDSTFGGGITGWGDLYAGSGVDRGSSDEEFLNNVMNYMWGDGNAVNLYDVYSLGNDYSNLQGLGWSQDAIEAAAKLGSELFMGDDPFAGGYGNTNLNMDDLGTLAVLSLMTQGDNFDVNRLLDPLSEENALTKGGELSKFGFVEDGSDAKEKEISGRKPYDLRMLGGGLDPYIEGGNVNNNLVDAQALDTYLDVYNANTKGPKLGLV